MKHLVGQDVTTVVKFMNDEVQIKQLSVNSVLTLQAKFQNPEADMANIETLTEIVKVGVIGADKLKDEDIQSFPLLELTKLANEIMAFSGLTAENTEGND